MLQLWPPKRYAHILIPTPVNVTLFGKSIFVDVIKLKIVLDHCRLPAWALYPVTSVFIRDKTAPQREAILVKMETEAGVMWPQVKEPLDPLEFGRGKEASLLEISASMSCKHLGCALPVSRTVRK